MQTQSDDVVWLKNNQPRLLHLPDQTKRTTMQGPGGMVQESVVAFGGRVLTPSAPREKDGKPQLTAVDSAYWNTIKGHKQVQVWLRKGWIEIADANQVASDDVASLAGMNERTALTIIEAEENPKLLTMWLKGEARASVRDSLETKITAAKAARKGAAALPPLK